MVDLAKAGAAVTIMLHHFSLYGPLAQALDGIWPAGFQALAQYGRFGVQVFFVVGGYLAADSLMRMPQGQTRVWVRLVVQRWWRLAGPFMAAVFLTLLAHASTARALPDLLPQSVTLPQLLAHAGLLHEVLGMEALTVGAWYVAIDFQLYALLSLLLVAAPAASGPAWRWALVFALGAASLLSFNRHAQWDHLAPYFFGSYALGVACAWLMADGRAAVTQRNALTAVVLVLVLALWIDFRGRLVCAAFTAAALLVALGGRPSSSRSGSESKSQWPHAQPIVRFLRWASDRSYALFLVHFAVCLWGNAAWLVWDAWPAWVLLFWMCVGSVLLAAVFYRWVERPLGRLSVSFRQNR